MQLSFYMLIACSMGCEHIVCVICHWESDDKAVKFAAPNLDKSNSILKINKEHNIKYSDVTLPLKLILMNVTMWSAIKNFLL